MKNVLKLILFYGYCNIERSGAKLPMSIYNGLYAFLW